MANAGAGTTATCSPNGQSLETWMVWTPGNRSAITVMSSTGGDSSDPPWEAADASALCNWGPSGPR